MVEDQDKDWENAEMKIALLMRTWVRKRLVQLESGNHVATLACHQLPWAALWFWTLQNPTVKAYKWLCDAVDGFLDGSIDRLYLYICI